MKTKLILLSTLAFAAMAVGCSKDDGSRNTRPEGPQADAAYLSVSVEAEKTTRAQPEDGGTKEEGTVSTAYAVTFDASYQKLNVVALTVGTSGTDLTVGADGKPTSAASKAISVSPNTRYLMMILNPSVNLRSAMNGAVSFSDFQQKVLDDVANVTVDNRFTMINRGVLSGTSMNNTEETALADCAGKVFTVSDEQNEDQAKAAAANNAMKIQVVRLAAKVGLLNGIGVPLAGIAPDAVACEFVGWQFNTINKTYLPYSSIVPYMDQDGALVTDNRIYRKDGNYEGTEVPSNEFVFLKNSDNVAGAGNEIAWRKTSTGYVLENTMAPNAQLQGYTTRMVVKAKYTPTGFTANDTWVQYVKEGVEGTPETVASLETKMAVDTDLSGLLAAIGNELKYASAADFVTALKADTGTDAQLNNVGYIAAKYAAGTGETRSYVRIYRQSECYYDLLIQHNSKLPEPMALGKFGVVRNNWYTLNVTKISKPGTSFIPDPTDPDIVDPANPEPTDPDEDTNSYISVTITIMPWTLWQQDIEI